MNDKQLVAEHAAQRIESGMLVGLGTGSTANFFIEALARRQQDDNLQIEVVASSIVSTLKAQQLGLKLRGMEHIGGLDVYVDGADEVAPDLTLLKGRGGDLVREKLLAKAAKAFWVLIDPSKHVKRIGQNYPVPIEVMPFAWQLVQRSLAGIGGAAKLRSHGDGLFVTSYGSLVLDTAFDPGVDGKTLNAQLNAIPGIVEHGIFADLTSAVFCGNNGSVEESLA
ncbi:ribose-5-phosphate isomerase RpiA [Methylomonas rivi]|uniref:Ribose 5-phosphate isomerase A n=1 Tax=Methylomonas rivi TaxID=2952226 RepID=A0ABT1U2M4_9GAMM|nr:ribose-5-phosphate isomerase RpiA [Methylomonas sp. WSC-6]MCQ8127669.1 ribose-5-phosphate isomerase RpiA [Methylomonas sp. WSC-6]